MHDSPTPAALHAEASTRWEALADPDPRPKLYLEADRRVTSGELGPIERGMRWPLKWARKLRDYEHFWRVADNAARENTRVRATLPASERHLGEWARYQRRFEGDLSTFQAVRLDVSPAFEWDMRQADWNIQYQRCLDFLHETGSLPRQIYRDPEQFAAARWLARQISGIADGSLSEPRRTLISRLLDEAKRMSK